MVAIYTYIYYPFSFSFTLSSFCAGKSNSYDFASSSISPGSLSVIEW